MGWLYSLGPRTKVVRMQDERKGVQSNPPNTTATTKTNAPAICILPSTVNPATAALLALPTALVTLGAAEDDVTAGVTTTTLVDGARVELGKVGTTTEEVVGTGTTGALEFPVPPPPAGGGLAEAGLTRAPVPQGMGAFVPG